MWRDGVRPSEYFPTCLNSPVPSQLTRAFHDAMNAEHVRSNVEILIYEWDHIYCGMPL